MEALPLSLVNSRTEDAVARRVEVAVTRRRRRKGLLGRSGMAVSSAMILAPCAAVHTMFMRFPIDVLFVDANGCALRIVPNLGPWRVAIQPFAHAVVEMPAGSLEERRVRVGDRLYLQDEDGRRVLLCAGDLARLPARGSRDGSPEVPPGGRPTRPESLC